MCNFVAQGTVRLHFLPESYKGKPELYQDIEYVKVK